MSRHPRAHEEIPPLHGDSGGPLTCIVAKYEDGTEIVFGHEIYARTFALLSHPGARIWLEALPGLMEMGEKSTPGPWEARLYEEHPTAAPTVNTPEDGDSVAALMWPCHPPTACDEEAAVIRTYRNAELIASLRNALHAAAVAQL